MNLQNLQGNDDLYKMKYYEHEKNTLKA